MCWGVKIQYIYKEMSRFKKIYSTTQLIFFFLAQQARSQGGAGGGVGLPPAQLKQVQFALNIKHASFDAMP